MVTALYGNGIELSERVLDYLWGRQTITLNNIVNIDTPGFKSQYVTFEKELKQKIQAASGSAPSIGAAIEHTPANVHTTWSESSRLDGNNVDMDQEQVDLVRTAYQYQHMVNSISNELKRLGSAAKAF